MKRFTVALIFISMAFTGCSFWKVTTLKYKLISTIKNGSRPGEVAVKVDESGLEDLTMGVGVFNGMICLADNELKRVQVMKPNGDVRLVIGAVKNIKKKDIPAENFNFGTIGFFTIDDDDNIYIQNKFSQIREGNARTKDGADSIDFSPSNVLVFNKEGELQYTLGQKGTPDTPFYHIERLSIDSEGRLFVISRSSDSWSIYRFKGRKREQYVNLGALDFKERDEGAVYDGKIDNVKPFRSGERLLISVSYYHGTRLKYIKIFEYSLEQRKTERTVMEIPDPKNVLFDIIDDKYIYLWNISNDEVRFEVANLDGTVINNVHLNLKYKRNYYSRIFLDESGKLYSFHVLKSGIDILRWE